MLLIWFLAYFTIFGKQILYVNYRFLMDCTIGEKISYRAAASSRKSHVRKPEGMQ